MTQTFKKTRFYSAIFGCFALMILTTATANAQSGSRNAVPMAQPRPTAPANGSFQSYTPSTPVYQAPATSGCIGCGQNAVGPVFNQSATRSYTTPAANFSFNSTYRTPVRNYAPGNFATAYRQPNYIQRGPVFSSFQRPVRSYRPFFGRSYGSSCGGY